MATERLWQAMLATRSVAPTDTAAGGTSGIFLVPIEGVKLVGPLPAAIGKATAYAAVRVR